MATSIVDATGAVHTLTSDHKIAIDGVTQSATSNVFLILYWYQVVYYRDGSSNWFSYTGTPNQYQSEGNGSAGDPRTRPAGSYKLVVPNLTVGTQYGFQVFAINEIGTSIASDIVNLTAGQPDDVPPPDEPPPTDPPPPVSSPGAPTYWSTYGYPNPGPSGGGAQDMRAERSPGGPAIPYGTATQNWRFFAAGGNANGVARPGMGIYASCHNAWMSFSDADCSGNPGQWVQEGGPFAPATGMIPVQACITQSYGGIGMTRYNIRSGAFDNVIKNWVTPWGNAGYRKVIYRPDYEWQIGTTPGWLQNASDVPAAIAAWQYIYDVMHTEAQRLGMTIIVGWNPCCISYTNFPTSSAYPGNNYCDCIMTDLYSGFGNGGDMSTWAGYAALAPGSSDQLSGWSYGSTAANQLALVQSAGVADSYYHFFDYPNSNQFTAKGGSAVNNDGSATFGGETGWGMMDVIHFAKQCGKPIGLPEIGYWSDFGQATTSGGPTYNVDRLGNGLPNTFFAPYLASRFGYAQSLGVEVLFASWNCYSPNDPYLLTNGSAGSGASHSETVQSIKDTFQGTGTPLVGYSPF